MANGPRLLAAVLVVSAAAITAGRAADLPIFLGAPARQALACGALADGLELPGTGTCLRVHGSVWAEVGLGRSAPTFLAPPVPPPASSSPIRRPALSTLLTTGRVSLDARTPTAFGPVRVYLSVKSTQ